MIPCTVDPERWFPEPLPEDADEAAELAHEEAVEAAQSECYECPARQKCLNHAITVREPHGIWGGWTEEERAALYERRKDSA